MNPSRKRSYSAWLLRFFMVVVCTAAFMYQAGSQVQRFTGYGYQSVTTEVKRQDLVFPSVTICSNSWVNKNSEACRKTPRLCTRFGQEVTFSIYRAQYEPEMRELVGYKPHEIFECRMESTSAECPSFSCVDHIRITFLRLPIMLCYTLDSTLYGGADNPLQKCPTPWLYELQVRLRFNDSNTLRLMAVLPFPVFVQRPRLCQPERNAAFALVPQQSYDITVKQQLKRRLPAPYPSNCKDYSKEGVRPEFYGTPSKESCTQTCLMKKEMELCSCHMSDHEYSPMFNGRICNLFEAKNCWEAAYAADIFPDCMESCQAACEDITYDSRVAGIHTIPKTNKSKETSYGLTLRFATDSLELVTEQPQLSVIEVFGYVGGYLGIWLGFSLLQTLEYHYNFFTRRYACCNHSPPSAWPNGSDQPSSMRDNRSIRIVTVSTPELS